MTALARQMNAILLQECVKEKWQQILFLPSITLPKSYLAAAGRRGIGPKLYANQKQHHAVMRNGTMANERTVKNAWDGAKKCT